VRSRPSLSTRSVANDGSKIELPDGTTLENKLVTGQLSLLDH